jgi:hypothetical protein
VSWHRGEQIIPKSRGESGISTLSSYVFRGFRSVGPAIEGWDGYESDFKRTLHEDLPEQLLLRVSLSRERPHDLQSGKNTFFIAICLSLQHSSQHKFTYFTARYNWI